MKSNQIWCLVTQITRTFHESKSTKKLWKTNRGGIFFGRLSFHLTNLRQPNNFVNKNKNKNY